MKVNCMNRDGAAYNLKTTYDRISVTRSSSTSRDHIVSKLYASEASNEWGGE